MTALGFWTPINATEIISSALLIKDSKEGQRGCVAEELIFQIHEGR